MRGGFFWYFWIWWLAVGRGMFLCGLGPGKQSPPARDSDTTSPGAVRTSECSDGQRFGGLGVWGTGRLLPGLWDLTGWTWGMGCTSRIIGSRELGPPARNSDTHLSKGSLGQGSGGQRCGRG